MKSFKVLLVEDELIIAEMIKEMLIELNYDVVGMARNFESFEQLLQSGVETDLAIIDINLSADKDGIDVANALRTYGIPHIFLTSYSDPETIKRAAVTNPSGYIVKPFSSEDLFATIELLRARNHTIGESVLVKEGRDYARLDSREILFLKSDNNYLEIFTEGRTHIIRNTIDRFLQDIGDSSFIRIHRSYAVNIRKIEAITGAGVIIGRHSCPISRAYKEDLLQSLKRR